MEKKVLLKELVDSGTNIRRNFIPKAVVSTKGEYQIGEFWDANKTIDVIVNNSHKQHDNIREVDEYTHNIDSRLAAEINRAKQAEDVGMLTDPVTGEEHKATIKEYIDHQDNTKQDTLVSGTNIKTIDNQSILGSGNIAFPVIPTNVSSFTNDSGYLTEHQSLANYYTKDEVDALIAQAIADALASLNDSNEEPTEPEEPSEPENT